MGQTGIGPRQAEGINPGIAGHVDRVHHPFLRQIPGTMVGRSQVQAGPPVQIDPEPLFRPGLGPVMTPDPGFQVNERESLESSLEPCRERGGGIPLDQDRVRP